MKTGFIFFNNLGYPIQKIEKELKSFSVVLSYFSKMQEKQPKHALDIDSQNRIWGILLAFICKKSKVNLLIHYEEYGYEKLLHNSMKANNIDNIEITKDINKIYDQYDFIIMEHKWNENATTIYNKIAKIWKLIEIGGKLLIVSHKKQGANGFLSFLLEKGLKSEIVGKGRGGVRLIEVCKEKSDIIKSIRTLKSIKFDFKRKQYYAVVDNSVFSKEKLDSGTEFLLEFFLETKIDLNRKKVGDFGSGWGAISLILINEFPKADILAIEKDNASLLLSKKNLSSYPQVEILQADLTDIESLSASSQIGRLDCIISNPPFHITEKQVNTFFLNAKKTLKSDGELFFVVEKTFSKKFKKITENLFTLIEMNKKDKYFVCRYRN